MLVGKPAPAPRPRATARNAAMSEPRPQTHDRVDGLVRILTIVGGKGGVGKSTVACALAIDAVDVDARRTLLVSTDPAPSLADALGEDADAWMRHDEERELKDPRGLVVRQMDATAAFARLRADYQTRIDALFSAMIGRGVGLDVERDRAIVRDLLALAPPGIDELYALSILGDALAEGRFERIIVDPAPTGHLLRLLDMPAVALDWSHRLMRLMLQYRDVVALGESAQELLDFAKRTRALDTLLHDASRCALVIVALDEPVVRTETERLVTEVQGRSIDVGAVVWNRARDMVSPLPLPLAVRQVCAEEVVPPPIGAAALRVWSQRWSTLSTKL
jgi:arsenite-transporting ATPase